MRLLVENFDIGCTILCGVRLLVVVVHVQPLSGIVDVYSTVFCFDLRLCVGCCGVVGESV